MELKPVKYNKKYELLIVRKINDWFNDVIFKGCFEILKNNVVENAQDDLIRAIQSGRIFYQDGAFYSATGRFSNVIAKELENIGAKYSKYRKAYLINPKAINIDILWAIQTTKAKTSAVVVALQTYITNQIGKLDEYHKDLLIDTAVEQIMFDLQKRVNKTLAEKKIPTIAPEINDFRANEIAKNYTNNLVFWIKDWVPEEMIKMRDTVGQMAIAGKSKKDIANYIIAQKGVSERKALFLARNETGIATTSYLQAKYQDEGFTHFKWITNMDGRERPLHRALNGKTFAFNDPPVIYQLTKKGTVVREDRGLPQQTYNCRCTFTPVFNKEFLENRRKK